MSDDHGARLRRYGHLTKDQCCMLIDRLCVQQKVLVAALENIETTAICRQELGGDKANADGMRRIATMAGNALDAVVGATRELSNG